LNTRVFPIDAEQNKAIINESKLQMPFLVLAGNIYPVLGGDVPGNPILGSINSLVVDVRGTVFQLSVIGGQKNSQNLW
jgi:hypothetical protein